MRVITFACCLLFACSENNKEADLTFNKNEFASLMAQIYLLDAQFTELPGPIKDSVMSLKVQELLKSKGLIMDDFLKIQHYYKYNYKEQDSLDKQIIQIVKDSAILN